MTSNIIQPWETLAEQVSLKQISENHINRINEKPKIDTKPTENIDLTVHVDWTACFNISTGNTAPYPDTVHILDTLQEHGRKIIIFARETGELAPCQDFIREKGWTSQSFNAVMEDCRARRDMEAPPIAELALYTDHELNGHETSTLEGSHLTTLELRPKQQQTILQADSYIPRGSRDRVKTYGISG